MPFPNVAAFEAHLVHKIIVAVQAGRRVHIRFDHDGTSAPLTGLADESFPIPELLAADVRFAACSWIDVGIITGRGLSFARQRYPHPCIDLDCSYGAQSRRAGIEAQHPDVLACQSTLDEFVALAARAIDATGGRSARRAVEASANDAVYVDRKDASVVIAWGFGDPFHPDRKARAAVRRADQWLLEHAAASKSRPYLGLIRTEASDNFEYGTDIRTDDGPVHKAMVMRIFPASDLLIYAGDGPADEQAKEIVDERGGIFMTVRNAGTPSSLLDATYVFESPEQFAPSMDRVSRAVARELGASAEIAASPPG